MLERIRVLKRTAYTLVAWFFLFIVWLASSVWIISPLLWTRLGVEDTFILLGRSLVASLVWAIGCVLGSAIANSCASSCLSLKHFANVQNVSGVLRLVWTMTGIYFSILTPSSALLLWYVMWTTP